MVVRMLHTICEIAQWVVYKSAKSVKWAEKFIQFIKWTVSEMGCDITHNM
jgi:hypothetical protein